MDNLDILVAQYKNIDAKLCSINDKLLEINTDTAINKNDILTLKQEISSLKVKQSALNNEINIMKLQLKDAGNEVKTEKARRWDAVLSAILKNVLPYIITLIIAGITLKIGTLI